MENQHTPAHTLHHHINIAKKNTEFYGNNFIPIEIGYKDFIENNEKISEILEEPIANQCSVLNYCMSKKISEKVLEGSLKWMNLR